MISPAAKMQASLLASAKPNQIVVSSPGAMIVYCWLPIAVLIVDLQAV
jgi:hypothetical protein